MFEARESMLEAITWDGEDRVEIKSDGWTFAGAKRKDFFNPDDDWESRLVPGARIRFWTIQCSRIIGFEWWDGTAWKAIWCAGNDFQTKAERKAADDAYAAFIDEEGTRIASLIDDGNSLAEIDDLLSPGHTGNTYGWALHLGIQRARYHERAEAIRREHNAKYGQPEAHGTINPALLTIKLPEPEVSA
jgi:hypothetical protein